MFDELDGYTFTINAKENNNDTKSDHMSNWFAILFENDRNNNNDHRYLFNKRYGTETCNRNNGIFILDNEEQEDKNIKKFGLCTILQDIVLKLDNKKITNAFNPIVNKNDVAFFLDV